MTIAILRRIPESRKNLFDYLTFHRKHKKQLLEFQPERRAILCKDCRIYKFIEPQTEPIK